MRRQSPCFCPCMQQLGKFKTWLDKGHNRANASLQLYLSDVSDHGGDVTVSVLDITNRACPHLLLRSCFYICLYDLFNCILFRKSSRQLSVFSLCSSDLISALLVLVTIHLFEIHSSEEALPIGSGLWKWPQLLMMTFHLRLKRISKPKHTRLKFDLEKLKHPNVLETFQAITGGKFAPLTIMDNEDKTWIQWSSSSTQK